MAGNGPQPTPTAILKLRGSRRAKTRRDEPALETDAPSCPRRLDKAGKAMWKQIVPELGRMRVLGQIDLGELVGACDWWGCYVERMEKLKSLSHEEIGEMVERRVLASAREAWTEFQRTCDRLGLSPAARTRLRTKSAASPKPQSELLRLMNGSKQSTS